MTVCFANNHEIINFLEKAGATITWNKDDSDKHYMIIGAYIGEPIGCTDGDGRLDVLFEEPYATFQEVEKNKCEVCNEREN